MPARMSRFRKRDGQFPEFRQFGNDVIGDPVTEIRLLGIVAQIFEWQNGDGRFWGHLAAGDFRGWLVGQGLNMHIHPEIESDSQGHDAGCV